MSRTSALLSAFLMLGCGTDEALQHVNVEAEPDEADAGPPEPGPVTGVNCAARSGGTPSLKLTRVAKDLDNPVYVTSLPGDASELYVVERTGRLRVIRAGKLLDQPFLDISDQVLTGYIEQGLLGLAFHPDYASNGRYFIHYVSNHLGSAEQGDVVVAEYRRADAEPPRSEPEAEKELLRVPQPAKVHKAGMLAFDRAGYLFAAIGNGGHEVISRETDSLMGKLLRLDVDSSKEPYGIPPGNLQGVGVRSEIWDWGLRNPWRFSFDACTGDIYIGDVGGGASEEVNVERAGTGRKNYGYPAIEGTVCHSPDLYQCKAPGSTRPMVEYNHDEGRCAIMGGFVYRGHAIPGLLGTYLYADLCTGNFWAFEYDAAVAERAEASELESRERALPEALPVDEAALFEFTGLSPGVVNHRDLTADLNPDGITRISSFGQDADGELYVVSMSTGAVYRIDAE